MASLLEKVLSVIVSRDGHRAVALDVDSAARYGRIAREGAAGDRQRARSRVEDATASNELAEFDVRVVLVSVAVPPSSLSMPPPKVWPYCSRS